MKFSRPVDERFPVCAHFMEKGTRWQYRLDGSTGFWIPRGSEDGAVGQHRGIDFDCSPGTLVSAMADGIIVKSRFENAVRFDEGPGLHILQLVEMIGFDAWWLRYTHLRETFVKVGQRVRRGQPLGETGRSGDVSYPMLHVDLMDTREQYHPIPWR